MPLQSKILAYTPDCFLLCVGFSHLDVMLVECYDPKADQWNILQTPILEGRSGPGCAVLDDSIYLVGGYSWSMVNTSHLNAGYRYRRYRL